MAMASSEDEVVDPNDAPVQELSLEAHFAHLENLGTLDIAHVLQYSTWGECQARRRRLKSAGSSAAPRLAVARRTDIPRLHWPMPKPWVDVATSCPK